MTGQAQPAMGSEYARPRELRWSRSEKAIARKAFDAALKRELQEVIQEAKRMASQIKEPSGLWELEHHLTQRRKEIDCKYDYRSSQLTNVFGRPAAENPIQSVKLGGRSGSQLIADSCLYRHMALKMETHISVEVLILHCTGRLVYGDETAAFRARVKHMLLGTNRIVVNLSGLEYIDSGGLGTLVGLLASTRNRHGEIKLVGPTKRVTDLLRQTRLNTVFHTYESDDDAVAAFGNPEPAL